MSLKLVWKSLIICFFNSWSIEEYNFDSTLNSPIFSDTFLLCVFGNGIPVSDTILAFCESSDTLITECVSVILYLLFFRLGNTKSDSCCLLTSPDLLIVPSLIWISTIDLLLIESGMSAFISIESTKLFKDCESTCPNLILLFPDK